MRTTPWRSDSVHRATLAPPLAIALRFHRAAVFARIAFFALMAPKTGYEGGQELG
ncbi:MAG TPA: hypothetical protein VFR86_26605 [Burkholderiaceae bacterium]|nr:hypothetical protein [Burkholderiaceae bacterium]